MINGQPVDLGQLRSPSLGEQLATVQRVMLESAGIEVGGRAEHGNDHGERAHDDVAQTQIVTPNGGLIVVGVCGVVGKTDTSPGQQTLVPWHSISRMGPA